MTAPQEQFKHLISYRNIEATFKPQENKNGIAEQAILINCFLGYASFKVKDRANKFIIAYNPNEVRFNRLQINLKLEPDSAARFSGLNKEEEKEAITAFVMDVLNKHTFKDLEGYKYFYGYMLEG